MRYIWFKSMIISGIVNLSCISLAYPVGITTGTYTIGGATPNYATFAAAAADLNTNGLAGDGPVIFNVRDGVYNEQITINAITNSSAFSYIIFKSENNDSTLVTITHTVSGAVDNFTVYLNGADYVTFELMTIASTGASYGRAVVIANGSNYNTFQNNVIQGKVAPASTSLNFATIYISGTTDFISFTNNKIKDGSYGLYMLGNVAPKNLSTIITANEISNNYAFGVYVRFADAPVISANIITTNSAYNSYQGINVSYCYNALRIEKNKISGGQGGYGINLEQFNVGTAGSRGRVANNFIQTGTGAFTKYGLYVGSSDYQDIYHNSVNVTGTSNGRAFYTSSGSNLRIKNNIFANTCANGGYAIYVQTPAAIAECDYNYLYTSTYCLSNLGYWSADRVDLPAWQTASSKDANSLSNIDPGFTSSMDLHTNSAYIDNAGTDLSGIIPDDIDGNARPVTPCIGADEYTTTNPLPPSPLSGVYTIGGASPDYATFAAAVYDLVYGGISGNVTFNVRPGTYNEQIAITCLFRRTAGTTITFQSSTGNRDDVVLTYAASGVSDNYTLKIKEADHVTFQNMTIEATGASYAKAVVLTCNTDNTTLTNNVIKGKSGVASASAEYAVVFSSGTTDTVTITDNLIQDGSYGIFLTGDVSFKNKATVISDNEIMNNYAFGIQERYADAPVISRNIITTNSTYNSYQGINAYFCYNALRIEKNKISGAQGGYGINLESFNIATAGGRGRIANNMVQIGSSTFVKNGIYIGGGSEYQDIYYNSVNITNNVTGTDETNFKAIYTGGGTNFRIKNNVFANTSLVGGYAIYVQTTAAITECNYNYYFTSTYCKHTDAWRSYLGRWGATNCEELTAWQAASGMDANSRSNINPEFVSPTDLHTNSEYIDNAGTDLSSFVTDDIDGDVRPVAPCMGADEYVSSNPPYPSPIAAGTYTIGGATPDYATINDAVDHLIYGGISGNVIFDIRPGTYNEQVWLRPLFVRAAGSTITFQSSTGVPADVILTHAATGTSDNYTLKIDELDYVTFQNMTIRATNATYGRTVVLTCTTDNTNLTNNVIQSSGTAGTECETVYSGGWMSNTNLSMNKIQGGYYGYFYNGMYNGVIANEDNPGHSFTDNEFTNNIYGGISLRYIDAPVINRNIFTTNSTSSGYRAINLHFISNNFEIIKNKISGAERTYGILLEGCVRGQASSRGIISNNFVQIGTSTYTKTGIYIGTANAASQFIDVYHNSVNITGSQTGRSIDVGSSCTNIRIKNNIFQNSSSASTNNFTMYIGNGAAISESDNNNFYKTYAGGNLAYWGANQVDLTALKAAASPKEVNSVSVDPLWLSATDLHLTASSPLAMQTGLDLSAIVPDDIDGEARPVIPWMGADEYDASLPIGLISFTAEVFEKDKVLLEWTTITEINNDYFTIEKTKDGNSFSFVTSVKGAGNSNSILNYKTTDPAPYKGTSYYRLAQTDFNGETTYSELRPVQITDESSSSVTLFPNPATDLIGVSIFAAQCTPVRITVYNVTGQRVLEQSQQISAGISFLQLDIHDLPAGCYFIECIMDLKTEPIQQKFIKY